MRRSRPHHAQSVEDSIADLDAETQAADVRLHSAFNELMILADNQFIENVRPPAPGPERGPTPV